MTRTIRISTSTALLALLTIIIGGVSTMVYFVKLQTPTGILGATTINILLLGVIYHTLDYDNVDEPLVP